MNWKRIIGVVVVVISLCGVGVVISRQQGKKIYAQMTSPATTGMVAPIPSGSGAPGTSITCNSRSVALTYWNTLTNEISVCDGTNWVLSSGPTYYNASGLVGHIKCWMGTTTSTTGGAFSQDISAAGITTLFYANSSIKAVNATAAGAANPNIVVATASLISGSVTVPVTIVVGGLGTGLATTSQLVWLEACGV